jgi:hypothetical protein
LKRTILLVLLIGLMVAFIGVVYVIHGPKTSRPKMNVMLITLDTTRADRLGCYGYIKPTSPNLD